METEKETKTMFRFTTGMSTAKAYFPTGKQSAIENLARLIGLTREQVTQLKYDGTVTIDDGRTKIEIVE